MVQRAISTGAHRYLPGLAASGAIALAALGIVRVLHTEAVEPLVFALILGIVIRSLIVPNRTQPGIEFAAKGLLEAAIVLLGLTLDLHAVAHGGAKLIAAVMLSVSLAILGGSIAGRLAGLSPKQAILIAVGNAVCGNSAIAAVAPAIRAKKHEVASAIALTALLGAGMVLCLPALIPLAGLSDYQYGVVAGLTVYAVPQVLAATFPVSVQSGQIGTLVKLTRVLLLGPVVAIFAILHRHEQAGDQRLALRRLLPWFVIGFAISMLVRTSGVLPAAAIDTAQSSSKLMTIVAMAGLGLSVDVQAVRASGPRVALVIAGLLIALIAMALAIVTTLHISG